MGGTVSTPIDSDFLGCAGKGSPRDMAPFLALGSRPAGALLALVSLPAVLAGCALPQTTGASRVSDTPAATATTSEASTGLVLRFDGQVATAVLDDTPVARQLVAMLPMTVQLSDPMGQAKSGPLLTRSLEVTGAHRTSRTTLGELVYWAPTSTVAVIYDDLGHRVPEPGLVRLGVIDTGLRDIAAAGNGLTVRIELAAGSGSRPNPSSTGRHAVGPGDAGRTGEGRGGKIGLHTGVRS